MVIQRVSSATLSKDVLYIGSAVPLETSEGLEAIQQPLRCRYPVDNEDNVPGIMSTVTILPEGIQLRYKADPNHVVLFPYSALSMCAAVRCVKLNTPDGLKPRFVSLSSPEAGGANAGKPSIFTAITRRTKGRQVLECHGFLTVTPRDALDLVQWTSQYDRRAKQGSYATMNTSANQSATYEAGFRGDMSFRTDTASLPDFPVTLIPGEAVPNAPPAFYKEPSPNGYFYATKDAQVKTFSLQKFTSGGATGGPPGASHVPNIHEIPPTPIPPQMAQSVIGAPMGPPPGVETLDRRHYAASAVSAPAYVPMGMRPPMMVPVRGYRPMMLRPVMLPPPPPSRARFFSPPPVAVRARPVPVMVPGPPPPMEGYYPRPHRRGSRGSSSSSSDSSSSRDSRRINGKSSKRTGQQNGDDSSESSSRPRTPPTDYDAPKGPRVSRRDEFFMRQQWATRNGSPVRSPSGKGKKGHPPPPRGYYMVPPYGYYPPPHPAVYGRPRSVPPYGAEHTSKKRKDKKSKKNKKDRKKHGKKGHGDPYDESADSVGYTSEFGNESRQPRDFRRLENQFQHERAFSKSLAEETRRSRRHDENMDPYSLNSVKGPDGEYPLL